MHKLEIKYLPPEKITKYARNTRTHSREQINQIKASIAEFGMCTPIGLHKGIIVYGHARYDALCELGHKEIPTVDLSHLTEAQKKAYVIADNKLALNAGWDESMLSLELQELQELDFDLDLTGFSADEIYDIGLGEVAEADLPDLREGDREPFQQMTFTLHDDQAEEVSRALDIAKKMGEFDSENENSNGNALARVCKLFIGAHNG